MAKTSKLNVIFLLIWVALIMGLAGCQNGVSGGGAEFIGSRPAAPTGVSVIPGINQLSVSWNAVSDAETYTVYYDVSEEDYASAEQILPDLTSPGTDLTNLSEGTSYNIWVMAHNKYGRSDISQRYTGTTEAINGKISGNPMAPEMVTVTSAGEGNLKVEWSEVEEAEAYRVHYSIGNDIDAAEKTEDIVSETSRTLTSLSHNTYYHIWVSAKNNTGDWASSTAVREKTLLPKPETPTGLSVAPAEGQLTLSWNSAEWAEYYTVFCSTGMNYEAAEKKIENIEAISAKVDGLANNTSYNVWVMAHNSSGLSGISTMEKGTPKTALTVPAAPTDVAVSSKARGELAITWHASNGASSYKVYSSKTGIRPENPSLSSVSGTSAVISSLADNTFYNVWVTAVNDIGEGPDSLPAGAKTILPLPAVPANVTASAVTIGQLEIKWDASEGANYYKVYYDTVNSRPAGPGVTGVTSTSTTLSGLSNDMLYYVWVAASNDAGDSAESTAKTAVTLPPVPAIPGNVTAKAVLGGLSIQWDTVSNASAYKIYYSTSDDFSTATGTADISGSLNTKLLTGLQNHTTYYIWVTAKNRAWESAPGTSVSAMTVLSAPAAPDGIGVIAADSQLTVSWNDVISARTFKVYMSTVDNFGSASLVGTNAREPDGMIETECLLENLTNGTVYYIWVIAVNTNGESDPGSSVSGVPSVHNGKLNAPVISSVFLKNINSGMMTVTYHGVEGAVSYSLYVSETRDPPPENAVKTSEKTRINQNKLKAGVTYYVWVRAQSSSGEFSDYSDWKTFRY